MDDVLPDLKTLEFLEARWRESTSYEQAEIAQAMYTFLLERGVVSDIRQDSESVRGRQLIRSFASDAQTQLPRNRN